MPDPAKPTEDAPDEGEFGTQTPIPPEDWVTSPLTDSAEWMGLPPIKYAGDEGEFTPAPEEEETP